MAAEEDLKNFMDRNRRIENSPSSAGATKVCKGSNSIDRSIYNT